MRLSQTHSANYQRTLNEGRVKRIVKKFSPVRVRRPLLSPDKDNPGRFHIVDGKHTVAALVALGYESYDCDVADMSGLQQVKTYVDSLVDVVKLNPLNRLVAEGHGADIGGQDPDYLRAQRILRAVESAGWRFKHHVGKLEPRVLSVSSGVEEIYDLAEASNSDSGSQAVVEVLGHLDSIWPDACEVKHYVVRGLGKVVRVYGPLTSQEKEKLRAIPVQTLTQLKVPGPPTDTKRRDAVANYIRKDVLGKRSIGEFRA